MATGWGQPNDHIRQPVAATGCVEEPRQPAPKRLAGRVLDGHVDLVRGPRVPDGAQRREHDAFHGRLESLGREALVENRFHGRHVESTGRLQEPERNRRSDRQVEQRSLGFGQGPGRGIEAPGGDRREDARLLTAPGGRSGGRQNTPGQRREDRSAEYARRRKPTFPPLPPLHVGHSLSLYDDGHMPILEGVA